eukprot:725194-Pleurochrysis_carterae.AAC.1
MAQLVGVLGIAEQLAKLGKRRHDLKLDSSAVPLEVRSLLPESYPYTCLSVFESILRGEIKPLYSLSGVFCGLNAA